MSIAPSTSDDLGDDLAGILRCAQAADFAGLDQAEAARAVAASAGDAGFFALLAVTDGLRRRLSKDRIRLCSIVNAKSGRCPEDCSFCAQSAHYHAPAPAYPLLDARTMVEAARRAEQAGALEFSLVSSGPRPAREEELAELCAAVSGIARQTRLSPCASLGMLREPELARLRDAGLRHLHHNLETSRSFFPQVCSSHSYDQRVATVRRARQAGLRVCCGGIFGLGESWAQRIELSLQLRELQVDSIPLNFLNPRPGTPMAEASRLAPRECLRIVMLFRLMHPRRQIVVCGGREVSLRQLQPLLFAAGASGMMVGGYLTTSGRPVAEDLEMLRDLGLRPALPGEGEDGGLARDGG